MMNVSKPQLVQQHIENFQKEGEWESELQELIKIHIYVFKKNILHIVQISKWFKVFNEVSIY